MIEVFVSLVVFSVVYDWLTTLWLVRWFKLPSTSPTAGPPITFFRPLKAGVPALQKKLADFFRCLAANDQVLFGIYASDRSSQEQTRAAIAQFPEIDATMVLCPDDVSGNPKIHKLRELTPQARHDFWVVLDSELSDPGSFLPSFRGEWQQAGFPVLSAPYRFSRLDLQSLPVLTTLLPGLAVLRRFGKIQNTLGACLALTRRHVAQFGGWENLAFSLAEDFEIGSRLFRQGQPVKFSRAMVTLENDRAPFSATLLQLHRVSVTYRVCQPWGFAGSLATMGMFWSGCLLVAGWTGWLGLLAVWISRIGASGVRAKAFGWSFSFWKLALLVPVSSVLEVLCWGIAWLPLPVFWAGRFREVSSGGQLRER